MAIPGLLLILTIITDTRRCFCTGEHSLSRFAADRRAVADNRTVVTGSILTEVDLDEAAKREFWEDFDFLFLSINRQTKERLIVGGRGDLNSHVGTDSPGY